MMELQLRYPQCPIKGVVLYNLESYKDERGHLTEVWRTDENEFGNENNLKPPTMCYISQTLSGVARGPHEHERQTDRFAFIDGIFDLYLWENREGNDHYNERFIYSVGADSPMLVEIPPGVVHAYKNVGPDSAFVLNLPNKLYGGLLKMDEVDEIRWEKELRNAMQTFKLKDNDDART
jgi:dTDP-4-dehydrorhamnose 3,5-epimerase